ncbi:hypothetical protein JZ751_021006, partial [Albula glossodonta]
MALQPESPNALVLEEASFSWDKPQRSPDESLASDHRLNDGTVNPQSQNGAKGETVNPQSQNGAKGETVNPQSQNGAKDEKVNPQSQNGVRTPDEADNKLEVRSITFTLPKGHLLGICGNTGSGKTSLLSSILEKMHLVHGSVSASGSFAYVSQQAWVVHGTVRDNILFGDQFDQY